MKKKRKQVKRAYFGLATSLFFVLLVTAGQQQKKPDVPYVPTPEKVILEMLKIADVGKDDVLYDLGCGDGRIVVMAGC